MAQSKINVEIKARCADVAAVRRRLESVGAKYVGLDCQTDTYFSVPEGRLKLRRGDIENMLIFYGRSDEPGPRPSIVRLYHPEDPTSLGKLLVDALRVDVVVVKSRHIYFLDNVKVHVDSVEGLGHFLEIEAIGDPAPGIGERLEVQCRSMMALLGVHADQLEARSYSDLLRSEITSPRWTP